MEPNDRSADIVSTLLNAIGVRVSSDELEILSALYARFAPERAEMAAIDVGSVEPATTVCLGLLREDER